MRHRERERKNERLKVLAILVVGVILTADAFIKMAGGSIQFTRFAEKPFYSVVSLATALVSSHQDSTDAALGVPISSDP